MGENVSAIEAIEKAMEGVTPGPWEVYDGCSWRRIGTVGRNYHDCAVLAPTVASDGHPDLTCAPGNDLYANLAYIAACNPVAMREVLALARQAEALQQEADSLKQTRQHSREASAALHDAFMEERKRVEALQRENAGLREALKPFADVVERAETAAEYFGACHVEEVDDSRPYGLTGTTWGDLRRARTLLGGENAE